MNRKPTKQVYDLLWQGGMAALKRAAKRARIEAARTGTRIIIWRDNRAVRISPKLQSGSTKS